MKVLAENTIKSISHDICTGCACCMNICPKSAISMKEDIDGFVFPYIDEDLCVNCGMCLNKCPAEQPQYDNDPEPECYAVMAADDIRMRSSSGGVFTLLADWVLENEGAVCGAAYTDNYHNVEHIIVTKENELDQLRGSKYVQSSIGDCFKRLYAILNQGKTVLFTGTPCQVAGFKAFLGKDYPNLYLADVVCHGTPPVKLFKQFIDELEREHDSTISYFSFRDKSSFGWDPSTTVRFNNGDQIQKKRNDSSFLNGFLNLLFLRECCGTCKFATLPRQGDLTLADFWDIHRYDAQLDDRKGTSTVLVNNKKGEFLLEIIRSKAKTIAKAPLSHAIQYNSQIKYSSLHHQERKRFFELIRDYNYSVDRAVNDALHRHFDICYVGWWYGSNYGSVLTSYALNCVLRSMGKTVLMLDFPYLPGDLVKEEDKAARRFGRLFYETSTRRQIDQYYDFNNNCDSFIVGSDQLWNWWSNRDIGSAHYFLDFADKKHKKISYSTSFGHDDGFYPEGLRIKISYLLHRFDAISVRETSGVDICRRNFGVDAVQTLDPVFLCAEEDYKRAIALAKNRKSSPYILAYILNPNKEILNTVRFIAEQKKMQYYIIIDGQGDQQELIEQIDDPNVLCDLEIADWLAMFHGSSYVVTDSYHGFCFSIIFKKQMVVFPNKLRGVARFVTLGKYANLYQRFANSFSEVIRKNIVDDEVDFDLVSNALKPEIEFSKTWLRNAIESEHFEESAETVLLWKIQEHDSTIHQMKEQIAELMNRTS